MSANTAPGTVGGGWRPTPPQRGSFPLDHDHECTKVMQDYLECLKYARGQNAHGCRLVARNYLQCRMDHGLMDRDEWKNLGLPDEEPKPSNSSNAK